MTEADTCRKYVVPLLLAAGWDDDPHSIAEQRPFTDGRIIAHGGHAKRRPGKRADYLLRYTRDFPVAVVEAKAVYKKPADGLQQAKDYASILGIPFAYSTNGETIIFAPFGDARHKIEGGVAVFSRELYFATYQSIAKDERRPGLYKVYPPDFFDLIIVDECHRRSAKEDSNWREILEYYQPAYQLGMTATPYTSIPTNILFFDRSGPTREVWYYEQPLPEGRKNYTKTAPIQFEEFAPLIAWWGPAGQANKRGENEHAWKVPAAELIANGCNLDRKNPRAKEDITHLPPAQLAADILKKEQRIAEIMDRIQRLLQK